MVCNGRVHLTTKLCCAYSFVPLFTVATYTVEKQTEGRRRRKRTLSKRESEPKGEYYDTRNHSLSNATTISLRPVTGRGVRSRCAGIWWDKISDGHNTDCHWRENPSLFWFWDLTFFFLCSISKPRPQVTAESNGNQFYLANKLNIAFFCEFVWHGIPPASPWWQAPVWSAGMATRQYRTNELVRCFFLTVVALLGRPW